MNTQGYLQGYLFKVATGSNFSLRSNFKPKSPATKTPDSAVQVPQGLPRPRVAAGHTNKSKLPPPATNKQMSNITTPDIKKPIKPGPWTV
jgi:hypothetical protein